MRSNLVVAVSVALLCVSGCKSTAAPAAKEGPEAKYLRVIDRNCSELAKLGRVPKNYSECFMIIGQYAWHGDGNGYFGTYEFYQPAFEQAKRSWYFHGEVLEGSDELWIKDEGVRFDPSVVGRSIGDMNMSYFKEGKYVSEWFTAKVTGIISGGLKLDRRALHHAEQFNMSILPSDYVNMCKCTTNFGPQFVDGHPVLKTD